MEKENIGRMVELVNDFENVWKNLSGRENGVELVTDELKTRFITKAVTAKRSTSKAAVEVLVFLRIDSNGKLKECSRCYASDWRFYFNHLGTEGQRIGMYCTALDSWLKANLN